MYDLTKDFEGRDIQKREGARYVLMETGWLSSFGELVKTLIGKKITCVIGTTECLGLKLTDNYAFRVVGNQIHFGTDDNSPPGKNSEPLCMKNLSNEKCVVQFRQELG